MKRFYFTWADGPDTEFVLSEDEEVFNFTIKHSEGDFPALDIEIRNPRIGLLHLSRKRWAWLSVEEDSEVIPLFFGRLIGLPQDLQNELVKLSFIARPPDYTDQKEDLAETLKVFPYYDPMFVSAGEEDNPDKVLEARAALWHIDRVTHEVSASSIIEGEDGTITVTEADAFYDALKVTLGDTAARRCKVTTSVAWTQSGRGLFEISKQIARAFDGADTSEIKDAAGETFLRKKGVYLVGAQGMVSVWPQPGTEIGGGWYVGQSTLQFIGIHKSRDFIVGPAGIADEVQGGGIILGLWEGGFKWLGTMSWTIEPSRFAWIPIIPVNPLMIVHWGVAREYTENLSFSLVSDVQDVVTLVEDDAETIVLNVPARRADERLDAGGLMPIRNSLRRSYFQTGRGVGSVHYLIALASAHLLARARAADIQTELPFDFAYEMSCRKNIAIEDRRLPGGLALGKVKEYEIVFDGNTGVGLTKVTVSCCIGRGGSPVEVPGEPAYCDAEYDIDYQLYTNAYVFPGINRVTYRTNSIYGVAVNDDGKNLFRVDRRNFLVSIQVTAGGLDEQIATITESAPEQLIEGIGIPIPSTGSQEDVSASVSDLVTTLRIELVPVEGGPFATNYNVQLTALKIPKNIDLEAESNA